MKNLSVSLLATLLSVSTPFSTGIWWLFLVLAAIAAYGISKELLRGAAEATEEIRRHPIFLRAAIGAGKSRLLGRLLAWQDFIIHEIPLVIIDPMGQTIANFLDKLLRYPDVLLSLGVPPETIERYMKRLFARLRYIDRSGRFGHAFPTPLYYRIGEEPLFTIANRFPDLAVSLDPDLSRAPIQGANSLYDCARNVGSLLFALGKQIIDAEAVIRDPLGWAAKAKGVVDEYPDELPAVIAWLEDFAELSWNERYRMAGTFLRKIAPFTREPVSKATVSAKQPGVTGEAWDRENLGLLIDYQHMEPGMRQFMMRWDFDWITRTVQHRGIEAGREKPVSVIVDELAEMVPLHESAANRFAAELDFIVSRHARNYGQWTCLATQSLATFHFSPSLVKALLNMKVQIQGATGDPDTADLMARKFDRYEPYRVKETRNVYMSGFMGSIQVVDLDPRYFTPEEQHLSSSYKYLDDLGTFEFLVQLPRREGGAPGPLQKISIERLDRGIYPDGEAVAALQERLVKRGGIEIEAHLAAERALQEPIPRLDDLEDIPFYAPA